MRDIFQSCFKNDSRVFAGVYFAYRIGICAIISFSGDLIVNMVATELSLIMILGIHAMVQPYKDRLHNMIDAALFFNLVILNGIRMSLFLYLYLYIDFSSDRETTRIAAMMTTLQIFFMCIPIIPIVLKIIKILKCKICSSRKRGDMEPLLEALEEE